MAQLPNSPPPVFLLDGHNLIFRSFTTLPRSIVDLEGQPVHAVYGLLGSILRLAREHGSEHFAVAFDVPEVPTFRHRLYPRYQGQRGPLGGEHADNFARQVDLAERLLPEIGVAALNAPGFEADDIIGTLATDIGKTAGTSTIVSTDRDLLQLVGPRVAILPPAAGSEPITSAAQVEARLGVGPHGVTTFKALAGDASDNIPGVAGIGEKTAAALVRQYESLENLFAHLNELPARTSRALVAGREDAFLFRQVVTIVTTLELPVSTWTLSRLQVDVDERPRSILQRLGVVPEK
jgi:DNA polymerase-1